MLLKFCLKMPYSIGRMLASKIAYSARNSAGRIYPSLLTVKFPRTLMICSVYQPLYFDFTAMLTVCIHGLGKTVNIFLSLCKHFQLWANSYRRPTFELNLLFPAE